MDIKSCAKSLYAIPLNESVLQTGVLYKNKEIVYNALCWHKFIIMNVENLSRNDILKTVLNHVQPADLIPIGFAMEGTTTATFFARNCGPAIEKLCKDGLVVENPFDKNTPMKVSIILRYTTTNDVKVDVSKNISKILRKRFDFSSTLNLDSFWQDPDLNEFCSLSQPKLMSYVLHLSKVLKPQILKLSNNEIRTLIPLEVVWGLNITSIDLRNNNIISLSELEPLSQLKITELWLEGNPLCENYDEYTYVQRVKEYCPKIEKLDGIRLKQYGFPSLRRNFLCDGSGHDLVDQFLDYYFTLYDSQNRQMLKGLYHRSALFSLTAVYKPGQFSSATAQLSIYKTHSRNLLSLADFSRSDAKLQQNSQAIIDMFNLLPQTEHDPYTFTVDLIYYTALCAVVVVSGVFRELSTSILDVERLLGFNRCFVLESINGEYCIVNEQLNLSNALNGQQTRAFKQERPMRMLQVLPPAQTAKQRTTLVNTLKLITNMTSEWSTKCLEECQYDLKRALGLFVDLYKVDKVPADGFQC